MTQNDEKTLKWGEWRTFIRCDMVISALKHVLIPRWVIIYAVKKWINDQLRKEFVVWKVQAFGTFLNQKRFEDQEEWVLHDEIIKLGQERVSNFMKSKFLWLLGVFMLVKTKANNTMLKISMSSLRSRQSRRSTKNSTYLISSRTQQIWKHPPRKTIHSVQFFKEAIKTANFRTPAYKTPDWEIVKENRPIPPLAMCRFIDKEFDYWWFSVESKDRWLLLLCTCQCVLLVLK